MTTSESKGRFFSQNESIRITNRLESIRIANWNALLAAIPFTAGARSACGYLPATPPYRSLYTLCASHDIARSALIIGVRRDKRLVAECV